MTLAERKAEISAVCVWTEPDVCSKDELTFTPVTGYCGDVCAPVWQWSSVTLPVRPVRSARCTNERPEPSTIVIQSRANSTSQSMLYMRACDLFVWFSPCQGRSGLYMNSFILLFLSQIPVHTHKPVWTWQMLWFCDSRFISGVIFSCTVCLYQTLKTSLHGNIFYRARKIPGSLWAGSLQILVARKLIN